MEALEQPTYLKDMGPIDFIVTPPAHLQALNTQKDITRIEQTTLFNSHFKCAVFDPTLNKVDCIMRLVPLEFAFTPTSWWCITDVKILKRAGCINIEDMRYSFQILDLKMRDSPSNRYAYDEFYAICTTRTHVLF